jgi:hypothetical protein
MYAQDVPKIIKQHCSVCSQNLIFERIHIVEDDTIFDSIVKNAIDFMKHSVKEIEKEPKYAVIHFCSSVELFFKARLMCEHWSLIFAKPDLGCLKVPSKAQFSCPGFGPREPPSPQYLGQLIGFSA